MLTVTIFIYFMWNGGLNSVYLNCTSDVTRVWIWFYKIPDVNCKARLCAFNGSEKHWKFEDFPVSTPLRNYIFPPFLVLGCFISDKMRDIIDCNTYITVVHPTPPKLTKWPTNTPPPPTSLISTPSTRLQSGFYCDMVGSNSFYFVLS